MPEADKKEQLIMDNRANENRILGHLASLLVREGLIAPAEQMKFMAMLEDD